MRSHTFLFVDKVQKFKVPLGVTSITVVARGAAGAGPTNVVRGGRVFAVVPVQPAEEIYVYVGGGGKGGTQQSGGSGGQSGEGSYGYGDPGDPGSLALGGIGGAGYAGGPGGGGGGGYYGGGGGGAGGWGVNNHGGTGGGGGGGGGSSYVEPGATRYQMWQGWKNATGSGLIVISWKD